MKLSVPSMQLGNISAAVGNAELRKKMASYTTCRKGFLIQPSYPSDGSYVGVKRQYRREILFVLHYRQTLSPGLLNRMCMLHTCEGTENVALLFVRKKSGKHSRQ
jgi:hypothetical protein